MEILEARQNPGGTRSREQVRRWGGAGHLPELGWGRGQAGQLSCILSPAVITSGAKMSPKKICTGL